MNVSAGGSSTSVQRAATEPAVRSRGISSRLMTAVVALSLAGCASPIVRWERPTKPDVPDYTLSYGITYANKARDAYQAAIDRNVTETNNLSSGLIGLGALIAGAAVYGAHRDTILGGALLGGTAYALGQWNTSRPRVLIYQAGVEGINCAVRAVTPLYISDSELAALGQSVVDLENRIADATDAIQAVRKESASLGASDAGRKLAEEVIAETETRIERARTMVVSARQFMTAVRRAGPELVGAVDRISAAVDKAVLDTIPDLSAVPKVVSGLAGLAGSFAPGAGFEASIPRALESFGAESARAAKISPRLSDAIETLRRRSAQLATATAVVQGRLAGYDTSATTSKLADCGVTGVETALKVNPTRIDLKTGTEASEVIVASGGASAIYSGTFLKGPPEGLSVKSPLAGDRTFQIVATKSLAQPGIYPLLITDASRKEARVDIVVAAAGPEKPAAARAQDAAGSEAKNLVDWFKANTALDVEGGKFTVIPDRTSVIDQQNVEVTVSCEGKPALTQEQLNSAFNRAFDSVGAVSAAAFKSVRITFKSDSAECIKAGAESARGRGFVTPSSLKPAQVREIQRALCMPAADLVPGKWGPKTSDAIGAWRANRGTRGTGSGMSLTQAEFDALSRGAVQCPR